MNEAKWEGLHQVYTALDPVLFARACGIDPDPWQRDVLTSMSKRIILNCARQTGKSTLTAILALHRALYTPKSLVLVLAPSIRQSSLLFKTIVEYYRQMGRPVASEIETALTVTLANGSRIVSLPGKEGTIRGFSGVSLLILDEAARVDIDLYIAVRPMLAVSHGRIILLSTPHGKRGFFWEEWDQGTDWLKIRVEATECPRISKEFLEQEKRDLGERWYRQEYCCEFEESEDALFRWDTIQRAFQDYEELDLNLEEDVEPDEKEEIEISNGLNIDLEKVGWE
jgi:hypothetical protein